MPTFNLAQLELLRDSFVHLMVLVSAVALLVVVGRSIPTGRCLFLLCLPIPLLFVGFAFPSTLLVLDVYNVGLMLACLIDRFLLSVDPRQLEVTRHLEKRLSIHQDNSVLITLVNNTHQPIRGWLADSLPEGLQGPEVPTPEIAFTLPAMGRHTLEYTLRPVQRGLYALGHLHLKFHSRLGLLWILKKGGRPEEVAVYPDLVRLQQMSVRYSRSARSGELPKRIMGVEGTQFDGLRAYAVGDDVRKMDWKATARLDTPVLRTFSSEVDQPILLLLDAGRKMETQVQGLSKFDWALNALLAFSSVSLGRGDQVGAVVFHRDVLRSVPTRSGTNHLQALLGALHDVQPEAIEPDYERVFLHIARLLKRRSLIVLFTDLIDPMASRTLMKSVQLFASHHLLLLVTLSDSALLEKGAQHPGDALAAYEKGVALDLLNLRRQALLALSKTQGAVVLDVPPEKMDEALIEKYLAIKVRNRL